MIVTTFDDLILCAELRTCESCKSPTYWMRPKQRSLGYCPDHSRPGATTEHEALSAVLDAFPGLTAIRPQAARRWHRGEYPHWVRYRVTYRGRPGVAYRWGLPPDAGPCRGCGYLVRLYGDDGYPFCIECDQQRKAKV